MEIFSGDIPYFETTGDRIRAIRRSKKMTQKEFSASLGIVQGFLCSIERGKKVPSDTLMIAIQHRYKINPDWLQTGTGDVTLKISHSSTSPVSSGIPLYKTPPNSLESISASLVREFISIPEITDECFAFEYIGDFMSPTIRDGDIVVIKPGSQPVSGDIILIVGQWGDSFLRRYRRRGDEVLCSADNSSYATFRPEKNIKILGIVHAVWRKIKI